MEASIPEDWVQTRGYLGSGFMPLVAFSTWRVAILRPDAAQPFGLATQMERHTETDEVFVLTKGEGMLLLGGIGPYVEGLQPCRMQLGTIYNVRKNSWHAILLSPDASVLIVENADTGTQNTEYEDLSVEFRSATRQIAAREGLV